MDFKVNLNYNKSFYKDTITGTEKNPTLIEFEEQLEEGQKYNFTIRRTGKDSTQKELKEFLEGLSQTSFLQIKKFFETMPQLRHEAEVKNPKTGVVSKVTFKGLQDFFQ